MLFEKRLSDIYKRVYSVPPLVATLKAVGALGVFFVAGVFAYGIGVLLWSGEYLYALHLALVCAIPFGIVTGVRSVIDSDRPYEVFDLEELAYLRSEKKKGHSFPSRHVFSAFLIGTLWLQYSVWFGLAALFVGVYLAIERVLLGIHFIRDTVAGAVIGALSGLIGILIL